MPPINTSAVHVIVAEFLRFPSSFKWLSPFISENRMNLFHMCVVIFFTSETTRLISYIRKGVSIGPVSIGLALLASMGGVSQYVHDHRGNPNNFDIVYLWCSS